jgi:uncharacterized BrkB/YihY/UPF0761 family membrane protein
MMPAKSNILVWCGYSLFAGVMACLTLMGFPAGLTYLVGDPLMIALTVISAGAAAFLCKIHEGSNRFWRTGILTWSFFVLASFLAVVIHFHFQTNVTDSPRVGIVFVVFFTYAIFAAFATLLGTVLFKCIIYIVGKCVRLPA